MFIERKGNGNTAISYEIHDDNGHGVQLTPEQARTLSHWLVGKAAQIHADINELPVDRNELARRHQHAENARLLNLPGAHSDEYVPGEEG